MTAYLNEDLIGPYVHTEGCVECKFYENIAGDPNHISGFCSWFKVLAVRRCAKFRKDNYR